MSFGILICGQPDQNWIAKDTFDHFTILLDEFVEKLRMFKADINSRDAQLFSAFCARIVLENSASIINGRLDPFRMMASRGFQGNDNFDYGSRFKAGYQWTGDIIPTKAITDPWNQKIEGSQIERALLNPYWEELFWRPAYTAALSYIEQSGLEKSPLIETIEPSSFVPRMKSELARLHSTLSKGVHWDYLAPAAVMDAPTLEVALDAVISHVALLGFTSHFIPTSYARVAPERAYEIYRGLF